MSDFLSEVRGVASSLAVPIQVIYFLFNGYVSIIVSINVLYVMH